ncbi:unnamed protein product [Calypogeia fissa]
MMASPGTSARTTWLQVLLPCLLLVLVVQVKSQGLVGPLGPVGSYVCSEEPGLVTTADAEDCEKHFELAYLEKDFRYAICQNNCQDPGGCSEIYKSGGTAVMLCGSCGSCVKYGQIAAAVQTLRTTCFPTLDSSIGIGGGIVSFVNTNFLNMTIKLSTVTKAMPPGHV